MTPQSDSKPPRPSSPEFEQRLPPPGQLPLTYGFVPRQTQVFLPHDPGLSEFEVQALVTRLVDWLNQNRPPEVAVLGPVLTFGGRPPNGGDDARQQSGAARAAYSRPKAEIPPAFSLVLLQILSPGAYPEEQLRVIGQLNGLLQRDDTPTGLRGASAEPNWLISAAQNGQGTGGPGDWPVTAPAPPNQPATPELIARLAQMQKTGVPLRTQPQATDAPVVVAILDSSPAPAALAAKWAALQGSAIHPVMATLLQPALATLNAQPVLPWPTAPFTLYQKVGQPPVGDYFICGQDYEMSDHGLFVASLIHMIAPQAQLELYPVLNAKGIGTVHDFTAVLAALLARQRFRPGSAYLVINLSLLVNSPAHGDPLWVDLRRWLNRKQDQRDFTAFEAVCHSLATTPGVVLVASAGNEANRPVQCNASPRSRTGCLWALFSWVGQWNWLWPLRPRFHRPEPQFPAAFADVIGVGSVAPDGLPAFYSNLCDTVSGRLTARVVPERNGYVSFGGAGGARGELGVYLGPLPRPGAAPVENASGWARWSGTSFAAPKISGLAALLLGTRAASDVSDLNEKLTTHIRSGYTLDGESIVPL